MASVKKSVEIADLKELKTKTGGVSYKLSKTELSEPKTRTAGRKSVQIEDVNTKADSTTNQTVDSSELIVLSELENVLFPHKTSEIAYPQIVSARRSAQVEHLKGFKTKTGGITYEIPKTQFKPKKKIEFKEIRPFDYWGVYEVDEDSFKDDNPIVKFNDYEDLELTSEECCGMLTDRIIAACSSHLGKNPLTQRYVLCKCDLSNKKLRNIDLLYYHHYLQHINLSENKLETLEPLEGVPFLIYLDASHNSLITVLDFKPPYYLTYVNLSHNQIQYLHDLSGFWSLKKLNLSHNKIKKIIGFHNLKYLEDLNLSYNEIKVIENLDHLNIITLNLKKNHIERFVSDEFQGFKTMPQLTYVILSHNELNSLAIFKNAKSIQSIYMENNGVKTPLELSYLKDLDLLVYLNLVNNPITKHPKYKPMVLSFGTKLKFLDTEAVCTLSKLEAESIFSPEVEIKTAEINATSTILTQMQLTKDIPTHILPYDADISQMIILVGPPSCRAEKIIENICFKKDSQVLYKLKLHTTCENPEYVKNFIMINSDHFHEMAKAGEFMVLFDVFKCEYGLQYDEYEKNNDGQNIFILYTDIYAALTLRLRGYRPWLVLTMPSDKNVHKAWFEEDFKYYRLRIPTAPVDKTVKQKCVCGRKTVCENLIVCPESCCKYTTDIREGVPVEPDPEPPGLSCKDDKLYDILQLRNLYQSFHQENPGIFYDTIQTDDPEGCYRKIKNILEHITESSDKPKKEYSIKKDTVYDKIIGERLQKINHEIDRIIHCKIPGCGDFST